MGFIDIKNLVFEYFRRDDEGNVDEMVEALSDVSMDVEEGEFIAIVGENGSGKSTLARQINALLTPSEGEVIVDGMDTADEELRLNIRKSAGMVFQNPDNQIVGSIVEEDVAFGPENLGISTEKICSQVNGALTDTEMNEFRMNSPNKLSGGQKQRVAIAGVLAMEPKCIIFDEATAMLDPKSRGQILNVAKRLNKEKKITVIWITHHMDEVTCADRIIVMKQGKVLTAGTPEMIFADEKMIQESGLFMPQLYQYVKFLKGQGIISEEDAENVKSDEQLISLVCNTYGNSQYSNLKTENVTAGGKVNSNNKISTIEDFKEMHGKSSHDNFNPAQGILLNKVSYIYNKGFANERVALNNITVHIGKGEFIAVVGHTGSGKSTLIQHFNGLITPDSGNVYYDGNNIHEKDFPLKKLRQKVGLVFQYPEYQLFADTVEQDVCFGPMNMDISGVEARRRAYKAIEVVGLPDTIYDASPLSLSGGQKRRVAIAGVIAMEPEFLVLDEPTAGLDPAAAKNLLEMLKILQKEHGMTIIIVSHNMEEVAEYAERVIVIDDGEICLDDKTWKVFENSELMERLGLNSPVGIKMLNALLKEGIDVDATKHTQFEIFGELCKLT